MVKLRALENFSLYSRFTELKNLKRFDEMQKEEGKLYKNDEFEVEKDLAKYLLNEIENPVNRAVVETIEVIPEKQKEIETPKKEIKKVTKTKK